MPHTNIIYGEEYDEKVFLTALCEITVLSLMFVSECRKSADDIEVETSGDAVVWKYASESEWHELVKISELNDNAEFRKTDTHIQWCTGKGEWHDLIAIAELTGAAGRTAFLADLTGNPMLK